MLEDAVGSHACCWLDAMPTYMPRILPSPLDSCHGDEQTEAITSSLCHGDEQTEAITSSLCHGDEQTEAIPESIDSIQTHCLMMEGPTRHPISHNALPPRVGGEGGRFTPSVTLRCPLAPGGGAGARSSLPISHNALPLRARRGGGGVHAPPHQSPSIVARVMQTAFGTLLESFIPW
jgi:hypothetical protein